jgi:hypothetical protein
LQLARREKIELAGHDRRRRLDRWQLRGKRFVGKDVFVHISAVGKAGQSNLNEGQVVEYEEVANKGKTSAENLKVQRDFSESTRYLPPPGVRTAPPILHNNRIINVVETQFEHR